MGKKIHKRHQLILKNLSKFCMKKDSLIYLKYTIELQKEGIHVIFSKGTTLEKKLCKLTPKKPIEESKHNIYRKYCSKCSATYIGESGIHLGGGYK